MKHDILSILKYETKIAPGGYFHLSTDWFQSDEEIKSIIIDQSNTYSKILSIYPKDFYLYLEQDAQCSYYRSNYPLKLKEHMDYYEVIWE
ncbi:hypothetical protein [Eremococcus coleocola]|uniref:hypothetical protein n=1 Tax=Eremococcus coleocola TaxID=88132 RepID=UPI00040653B1|nr:hypothetical protein [Eremococcus coleocola]